LLIGIEIVKNNQPQPVTTLNFSRELALKNCFILYKIVHTCEIARIFSAHHRKIFTHVYVRERIIGGCV
jgi:hypothetical protein